MTGGYDWGAIKEAHPIVDVIGKTVALRKAGTEYKGLCPFHAEKSPSFHVIPEKGFAHCFGCGWHGDALDFVAATQGLSPRDAIAALTGGTSYTLTAEDKADRARALKEREAIAARERKAAIAAARTRWDNAGEASDLHPYLVRKGVPAHFCRVEGDSLLLPIYGTDGDMQSVQTIADDGGKRFAPGAPTKAGRAYIGVSMGRTIIAEGFATAASLYAAMPDQVCIAYSKGNMVYVARELAEAGVSIMLAADTGAADEMRALGAELGCPVAVPEGEGAGDFNDQATASGADNVRATLDKALRDHAAGAAVVKARGGLPFDIGGVCLKNPPGFVGEVAAWIESNNLRPRRHISVAAALLAIGNIAGMRIVDAKDRVTANLFALCIAGSGTGKENVNQSVNMLHKAAGCVAASHGTIKSEQEIVKNLLRHQAAFYVIDEFGIFLKKVKNAQDRGGASYLEGVIGMLMSAYSKASGFFLLSGDVKEQARKDLMAEAAQLQRTIDDGDRPGLARQLENVLATLNGLDSGLERPFLSLVGFTTPVTFDALVDFHSATNGFIGRSLLFNERDTAPRAKRNFRRVALPEHMAARLAALHNGGDYDTAAHRVEWRGEIAELPTSPDALTMLGGVMDWFEDAAIAQKGISGLEGMFLRGYELVSKVSLILGIPEGERTAEHVRWAFALVKRDLEDKMRLVIGNDREKDAPTVALTARIESTIGGDEGETKAVIYNRLRGADKAAVDLILAGLVESGRAEAIETGAKYRGATVVKYRLLTPENGPS